MIGIAYCLIIIRIALTDTFKINTVFSVAQAFSCQVASANPMESIAVHLTQCMHTHADANNASDSSGKTIPFRST
jgi:hypothetical protein